MEYQEIISKNIFNEIIKSKFKIGAFKFIETYGGNNFIFREQYLFNGKYHRDNGPASIYYCESGEKVLEYYYQYGKIHNENGPAKIVFSTTMSNGGEEIIDREYYLFGNDMSKKEWENQLQTKLYW